MKKTRRSEAEINELYKALQGELGNSLGQMVFTKRTGVTAAEIAYYWGNWSAFVVSAGGTPNTATPRLDDDEVFRDFAKVCLTLGQVPTQKELRIATRKLSTKTSTVDTRFGSRKAFDTQFRAWLESQQNLELQGILELPGWVRSSAIPSERDMGDTSVAGTSAIIHPFLPANLQHLAMLARGEAPPFAPVGMSIPMLFEQRVADAFRCLGFEVQPLGQGSGRNADCLAMARRDGYALIIDAKVRRDGYVLGTEDRKFLEYAVTHARDLGRQNIARYYLVIVGPQFRESDLEKLASYLSAAPIRSIVMIVASALMRMVEESIRDRSRFALADLERELFGNRIISA